MKKKSCNKRSTADFFGGFLFVFFPFQHDIQLHLKMRNAETPTLAQLKGTIFDN